MDRYKECERLLKVAVAQQCKENGGLIKQDFTDIGRTTTGHIREAYSAGEFVRRCFSYRGATEENALKASCDVLMKIINYVDKEVTEEPKKDAQRETKSISLSEIAKLLTNQTIEEENCHINICHLCDYKSSTKVRSESNASLFKGFNDGFYEMKVVKPAGAKEKSTRSSASDEVRGTLETYNKAIKSRYITQSVTILSEDVEKLNEDVQDATFSEGVTVPKNLNIQKLLSMSGQAQLAALSSSFEPYYECDKTNDAPGFAEDEAGSYVGGLHPPLHTYYTKAQKKREDLSIISSKNCLRRIFCERKPELVDRILEKSKGTQARDSPFALLARGTQSDHTESDMLLVNETLLQSTSLQQDSKVEYIAFIGSGFVKAFKCQTYGAYIYPHVESQRNKLCSSLYASEVEDAKLKNRVMLKLLRYELAWRTVASQWRSQKDIILKAISNIEWGCMWQDWNFFTGGIVTELDFQNIIQRLKSLSEDEPHETVTMLREICDDFIDNLNLRKRDDPSEPEEVSNLMSKVVMEYEQKLLSLFDQSYSLVRNKIYTELKPLHSKGLPQNLASHSSSTSMEVQSSKPTGRKQEIEYMDEDEVNKMRLDLLPKYNMSALELSSLTSLDDIIGHRLMEHPTFSGEPFLELLNNPQKQDVPVRRGGLSNTAMDLCRKCADAYISKSITTEKTKLAKALAVLNALVLILRNSEKLFSSTKELQESFGPSFRLHPEVATWIITIFYERGGTGDFFLNLKGYQKLICHIMWLCIYLSGGSNSYNFATLRNVDLKGKQKMQSIFEKCAPIAGLTTSASSKSYVYTIALPLGNIPKTTSSSFKGLVGAISSFSKRQRR